MKVAQHTIYKKNKHTLEMTEIAKPAIKAHQVLVKVMAAGLNPLDLKIAHGAVNIITPYKLPQTAGNELAGVVEQIGDQVRHFQVGDRVFARLPLDSIGAFADYVAVDSSALAKVPAYLTDVEAAAIPLTALTFMQSLDLMKAEAGKTIFISGGTGGVGAMAIPLAKARGLTVITNGSGEHTERVLALGADQFIDYKKQDYTKVLNNVDYVLDTLGGDEIEKQMTIMKKGGALVTLNGLPTQALAKRLHLPKWKEVVFGLVSRKYVKMAERYGVTYDMVYVEANGAQLQEVADHFIQAQMKPSIDVVYPFEEVNAAMEKIAHGRSRGKTVLTF